MTTNELRDILIKTLSVDAAPVSDGASFRPSAISSSIYLGAAKDVTSEAGRRALLLDRSIAVLICCCADTVKGADCDGLPPPFLSTETFSFARDAVDRTQRIVYDGPLDSEQHMGAWIEKVFVPLRQNVSPTERSVLVVRITAVDEETFSFLHPQNYFRTTVWLLDFLRGLAPQAPGADRMCVYCFAGKSRSVAVLAASLTTRLLSNVDGAVRRRFGDALPREALFEVLRYLRERRLVAWPNPAFCQQLETFVTQRVRGSVVE